MLTTNGARNLHSREFFAKLKLIQLQLFIQLTCSQPAVTLNHFLHVGCPTVYSVQLFRIRRKSSLNDAREHANGCWNGTDGRVESADLCFRQSYLSCWHWSAGVSSRLAFAKPGGTSEFLKCICLLLVIKPDGSIILTPS